MMIKRTIRFYTKIVVWSIVFAFFPVIVFAAATLDFIPQSQTLEIGDSSSITLFVDSGGDTINAAESTLSFPNSLITITGVTKAGLFSYWPEDPIYSNATGIISFAGGLPDPGYNGTQGDIIIISYTADAEGIGQICETNSKVLKNDGLGTDITGPLNCASITVNAIDVSTPIAPTVISVTHPDQEQGYAESNPEFSWDLESGVTGFSYLLDDSSVTVPDDTSEGVETGITYANLTDGVWYFHIKAENENGWGEVTHFSIQIDTEAPTVTAEVVGGNITNDTTPDISITASDSFLGIERVDITVDGITTSYTPSQLPLVTLDELEVGEYIVLIEAFDLAGNSSQVTLTLNIKAKGFIENIGDTINEIIPESVKEVVRNITEPVQEFIADTTKPIRDLVDNLKLNKDVIDITEEIAEPVAITAAAIGVATAVATLPVGLVNALFAFLRFGYLFLSPLFIGKRGKSWGIVVNSVTQKAISGAVVRVFETEFQKMKESQITDALGRFGFLVEPGTYTVTAEKKGFTFPSHLVKKGIFSGDLYIGGDIVVDDKQNPHITATIPLDPDEQHMAKHALAWKRVRDAATKFLEGINWPLLVIGTGVSVWSAAIVPSTLNTLLFLLYISLIILKFVRKKLTVQSFGQVLDVETKEPLGIAVVRIFDAEKKTLITTRITNEQGKFSALVPPGSYYVVVTKPPYTPYQSTPITLSKSETLAMDVELSKGVSKFDKQQIPPKTPQPTTAPKPLVPPTQEELKKREKKVKKEVQKKGKQEKEIIDRQEEQTHQGKNNAIDEENSIDALEEKNED